MKTILVPVDFSESAKNAMDYAIVLAKKMRMKLLLLYVDESISKPTFSFRKKVANPIRTSQAFLKKELRLWRDAVCTSDNDLICETVFTEGELVSEIIALLEEKPIDLLVMGTKGATGLKELFVGSNTSSVIERIYSPLFVVPEGYQLTELKKIVFATDYHRNDISSIKLLAKIAKLFEAELTIVHVKTHEVNPRKEDNLLEYFKEQVEKSVDYKNMKFKLLRGTDVSEVLHKHVSSGKADLLAIATEERLLIGPIFNRGLTKQFAHESEIPLLTFHTDFAEEKDLF